MIYVGLSQATGYFKPKYKPGETVIISGILPVIINGLTECEGIQVGTLFYYTNDVSKTIYMIEAFGNLESSHNAVAILPLNNGQTSFEYVYYLQERVTIVGIIKPDKL